MGHSYRDLIAWQKAIQFILMIYRVTDSFPDNERYGLVSQLRRAAVSIASNIAELIGSDLSRPVNRFHHN